MKMRLAKFEDDDEPGFVAQSLHQKCPYCTLAWIRGVNDRRDGYTCKLVHLDDDEAGMIRCSKRNKLAKKRTFLCTKRISNTARGIEIKAERSKKRSITQIFFAKPVTLEDAHKSCNRRGYRLGVFHDIPEAAHVMKSYLKKCSGCGGLYWISTPPWTR
ncbi:hypothetical protein OESDEN_21091 [Oesophagostomum dentatum]|uniref:C-type lectin domain-containing protein n=1 Tax=Oesophagostomum dentatum TaxID=61180 RepID=A0A0B1S5V7_OESDE|nr:hypothetical protein OESDEN_21091 [Oesophagostomum dentatum]